MLKKVSKDDQKKKLKLSINNKQKVRRFGEQKLYKLLVSGQIPMSIVHEVCMNPMTGTRHQFVKKP